MLVSCLAPGGKFSLPGRSIRIDLRPATMGLCVQEVCRSRRVPSEPGEDAAGAIVARDPEINLAALTRDGYE